MNERLGKISCYVFAVIIGLLLFYRLLHIDNLLIYKHSWGESQYAMMAKAYIENGFFWGVLQTDKFSAFTNYIPISSLLAALFSYLFDTNLISTGRLISFLFSTLTVYYFFLMARTVLEDALKATIATLFFTSFPISMYYSKAFYNEPIHIFFIVIFLYVLFRGEYQPKGKWYHLQIFVSLSLVLFTKPTTILLLSFPLTWHFWQIAKKDGLYLNKLLPFVLPVVFAVAFFGANRVLFADQSYNVESDKLFDISVIDNISYYAKSIISQYQTWFGKLIYIVPIILALCTMCAFKRKSMVLYFILMVPGFFIFLILFIKGAIVHQYYSLPLTIPLAMLATEAIFLIRNVRFRLAIPLLLTLCLLPYPSSIKAAFNPEYSEDLIYVSETIKRSYKDKSVMVIGKGHRIIQYYLGMPSKHTFLRPSTKEIEAIINNAVTSGTVDLIIIGNTYIKSIPADMANLMERVLTTESYSIFEL